MTRLRRLMLDELQRRNYAQNTVRTYIKAVEDFARYFGKSPEKLGPEHIRQYQVHLFRDRKLAPATVEQRGAALRFLYVKTLHRPYLPDQIPFPKRARRLPVVLAPEEVALLIDSAKNLMHRAMLMTLYATGLRRAELCRLKVSDIDSERIVIHVHQGKGGRDRDVLLSPKLLDTLREPAELNLLLSAEFLSESNEKPFRPADVAEPIRGFILDDFANEVRAPLAESFKRLVDIINGEHDAEVA